VLNGRTSTCWDARTDILWQATWPMSRSCARGGRRSRPDSCCRQSNNEASCRLSTRPMPKKPAGYHHARRHRHTSIARTDALKAVNITTVEACRSATSTPARASATTPSPPWPPLTDTFRLGIDGIHRLANQRLAAKSGPRPKLTPKPRRSADNTHEFPESDHGEPATTTSRKIFSTDSTIIASWSRCSTTPHLPRDPRLAKSASAGLQQGPRVAAVSPSPAGKCPPRYKHATARPLARTASAGRRRRPPDLLAGASVIGPFGPMVRSERPIGGRGGTGLGRQRRVMRGSGQQWGRGRGAGRHG